MTPDDQPLPPALDDAASTPGLTNAQWARRVARERAARQEAERLLDDKALELWRANQDLGANLRQISALLDAAPHSVLTIEADLTVGRRFSASAPEVLGRPSEELAGAGAIALLTDAFHLSGDAADTFRQTLEVSLGSDELNWALNRQHLPTEISVGPSSKRVLEVIWTPLIDDAAEIVSAVLVSLRDVTAERELAARIKACDSSVERLLKALEQLLRAPAAHLPTFFSDAEPRITQLDRGLHSAEAHGDDLLIAAHTLKGGARLLGFADLAERIHALEQLLAPEAPSDGVAWIGRPMVAEAWTAAKDAYDELRRAFVDVFRGDATKPTRLSAIVGPHFEAARRALEAEDVAARFRIEDAVGAIAPKTAAVLTDALQHLAPNLVDHSVLPAARDGSLLEADVALEAVRSPHAPNRVVFRLTDNGRGFDHAAIAARAARRGIPVDPADPLAAIFEPRFSTADQVSLRSGRGVGMTAVRAMVEEAGGSLRVGNRDVGGSVIEVELPNARM